MGALRSDPAARRRRIEFRVSTLKRRLGIASVLGFGALFGLVTQHAVGSQKHKAKGVAQPGVTRRSATSFFDSNGPGYSFDDNGVRAAQQRASASAAAQQSQQPSQGQPQQSPVAQSGGS